MVGEQRPSTPAAGTLEQIAGLLVARAAPFDAQLQAALLSRWGLAGAGGVAVGERVGPDGTRSAYARLIRLARESGTPPVVEQAVALTAGLGGVDVPGALEAAGMSGGLAGAELVAGLRAAYGLDELAGEALARLGPADRLLWHRHVRLVQTRGVEFPAGFADRLTVLARGW